MEKLLTTSEAVRAFSMHPATVLRLILTGRVDARKNGDGHWLISRSSLEHWNRERIRRPIKRANGEPNSSSAAAAAL